MTRTVVLLGPQRFEQRVSDALADLDVDGEVAVVNAGWGEREGDDGELRAAVGGAPVVLSLYRRWRDVVERDRDFALADRARRDRLEELQRLYLGRLDHAVEAVRELARHDGDQRLREALLDDAVDAVRRLDDRHLRLVAEVDDEFHASWPPHERPVVAEHREELARLVDGAAAVAIAGGHVGVLARCLHVFNLAAAIGDRPVVAWSAGAMAVAERIVLFHDFVPHGAAQAVVHGRGIGLVRGVVPLPHARARLDLHDHDRMRLLARRFAPARLVPLERGTRVDVVDGEVGPSPRIADDGTVRDAEGRLVTEAVPT